MLDKLGYASVFSTINLANAYHQVHIHEPHVHHMAFFTPFGQYEFTVLLFGLTNASSAFQRIINITFSNITTTFVLVCLNDIFIYSKNEQEHLEHTKAVLQHLIEKQFKAKYSKCKFSFDTIKYLGHDVSKGKVYVDPDKTDAIYSWPTLTCVNEVQQSLVLANYYNQFIKQFSQISTPPTKLLQKSVDFVQSSQYESDFQSLKDNLYSDPVL